MAKLSITDAGSIDTDAVLHLGKYYRAKQFQSLQAKLTGTVREIRNLTSGNTLGARIGEKLSIEQRQLLHDAAKLIESVNTHIEHAKEKRSRDEKQAERRQQARNAEAKRLVAETYPLPGESLDQLLEIIKTVLTFNRAGFLNNGYTPREFNLRLQEYLSPSYTRKLIGWTSVHAFWKSQAFSLRNDFIHTVEHEIGYDDGSSVQDRLDELTQKVAQRLSSVWVSADEEKTLRLWTEAFSPAKPQGDANDG